jgi:hypothetical protein
VLDELARRVPWIALGNEHEWRTLWKQGPEAFAHMVDERRKNLEAAEVVVEPARAPQLSTTPL